MHFSKTYDRLLLSLPPELRNDAFEYRKLKRLINRTQSKLDSLGLGTSVLRSLHGEQQSSEDSHGNGEEQDETSTMDSESTSDASHRRSIVYEVVLNSSVLEARLRLSSTCPSDLGTHQNTTPSTARCIYRVDFRIPEQSYGRITETLIHPPDVVKDVESDRFSHMVVPLPSDTEFFKLLRSTLSIIADRRDTLQADFNLTLFSLAASISKTARPASSSAPRSFSAYSSSAGNVVSLVPSQGGKSDLYIWREIFQLYAETEIFESVKESTRCERSIEEAETHLELFKGRVLDKKASLVLPGSQDAFDAFLKVNWFILNVKKLQLANSEATRKIIKKHAKRTTLPVPSYLLERNVSTSASSSSRQVSLITRPSKSLPRLLVQAIGEVLLPIIPHIDDYACLICASVAFKPVRLHCGHFFCVRCLVKLQKRHLPNCPMCRAPTVLQATPANVDYGLLNFIADWFPIESREKLRANEQEVTREQLEALGIVDDVQVCRTM